MVATSNRFKHGKPCPICKGFDGDERGRGTRCFGFMSDDGNWAHCTREDWSGGLPLISDSQTYAHLLFGDCNCGTTHNPAIDNGMKKRIIKEYDYIDEQGEMLYQVCRTEPKGFFQRRPDSHGGWINKLDDVRRVLYRLPELIKADKSEIVWLCEGERDADALVELGLVATTNAGGAGKWRNEYNEPLKGRSVVILPDNDDSGRKHAAQVAKSLNGFAANVKVIELPNLPDKGDVCDWLKAGGTKEQLGLLVQEAEQYQSSSNSSKSSNSQTHQDVSAFPKLNREKALYGLAGDIVRAIEPHSESDPVAVLVQLLVGFGNLIGRSAHFEAEADKHYTNLFTVIVGESSRGRKGSSLGYINRLLKAVDEGWASCGTSGLSSGEGLIHHVRDEEENGFMPGAVRQSKRAMVIESEFASVLRVQGRDGNILSTIIRQSWDSGNLSVMRRDRPDRATNAHISIIGHITNDELKRCLKDVDAANGFANRFLWIASRRSKKLPEGGKFHEVNVAPLVKRLKDAVDFSRHVGLMRRDEEARELWRDIYYKLDEEIPDGRLGSILNRAEAQLGRLACVYALLDSSDVVKRVHLEAAKAVWDYSVASARFIFGENILSKKAQKLLDALQNAGSIGLNKTQLYSKNGGRPDGVNEALAELKRAGYAFDMRVPTAGRDEERWIAASISTQQSCEDDDFDDESQNKEDPKSSGLSNSLDSDSSSSKETVDELFFVEAIAA